MKTNEALLNAQLQALLFESLKNKTHVFYLLVEGTTIDAIVVEVANYELV
jgi:hypothetical protein